MASAQRFKQPNLPRQAGELARFKVVQGPDFGAVYVLNGVKAKIGRGEDNDVVISDLKASRHHAQIALVQGAWIIRDSGSANGIHYNGKFVREISLKGGEVITLGETTLEFLSSPNADTQMLVAPVKDLVTLRAEQSAMADKRREVRKLGGFGGARAAAASLGSPAGAPVGVKSKRPLIYGAAALGLIGYLYMDSASKQNAGAPKGASDKGAAAGDTRNLASYLPQGEAKDIEKSAESFSVRASESSASTITCARAPASKQCCRSFQVTHWLRCIWKTARKPSTTRSAPICSPGKNASRPGGSRTPRATSRRSGASFTRTRRTPLTSKPKSS